MNTSAEVEQDSCTSFIRKAHQFSLVSQNLAALSSSLETHSSRCYVTDGWPRTRQRVQLWLETESIRVGAEIYTREELVLL